MNKKRVFSAILAASMLQPAPPARSSSKFAHISQTPESRQEYIFNEATKLLTERKKGTLDPTRFEQVIWAMKTRHIPAESSNVRVADLYEQFQNGLYRWNFIDSWSRQYDNTHYTEMPQEHLQLADAWNAVAQQAVKITLERPSDAFGNIFEQAVRNAKPEQFIDLSKWKGYNFHKTYNYSDSTGTNEENAAATAYDLLYPRRAANELAAMRGEVWRNKIWLWRLDSLQTELKQVRLFGARIQEEAKKHNLPAEDLALLLAGYTDPDLKIPTPVQNPQRPSAQQQPFAMTVRKMTYALLPHIRRMHQNGIEGVIIADRGARPLGKIFSAILKEFELPQMQVGHFKFAQNEKIVEAYARTADASLDDAQQYTLSSNAALRKQENTHRQSKDTALRQLVPQLQLQLEQRVADAKDLYEQLMPAALSLQQKSAAKELGGFAGKKIEVIDDWRRTGKTCENIVQTLKAIGLNLYKDQVISIVDTPSNTSRKSLYADADGVSRTYAQQTDWRDSLPWYSMKGCSGIAYGMDIAATNAEKLFSKRRELATYRLAQPKHAFYSEQEKESIAQDVAKSALVDQSTAGAHSMLIKEVAAALASYKSRESFEATQRRVNIARVKGFAAGLQEGVHLAVQELRHEFGAEAVKLYLGGSTSLKTTPIEGLICDIVGDLHSV